MRIIFDRTGGFAGLKISMDLELSNLDAAQAENLLDLIKATDFFNVPEPENSLGFQDGFQYSITIKGEEKERTIHANDRSMTDWLRPMIDELTRIARSYRQK